MTLLVRIVFWIMFASIVNKHDLGIFTLDGFILFLIVCAMLGFEQYVNSNKLTDTY